MRPLAYLALAYLTLAYLAIALTLIIGAGFAVYDTMKTKEKT